MSKLRVTALVCPDCGGPLAGLRYDKVYFCKPCGQAVALGPDTDPWVRYPLSFALLKDDPGIPVLYLPFWELGINAIATATNKNQARVADIISGIKSAWVSGFTMLRASYFGDLGLLYTERFVNLSPAENVPHQARVAGCTRSIEDALRYARLFITLMADKKADVTGMEFDIKTTDARLWAIPFGDMGDKVLDFVTNKAIPVFAVDDISDIRRINGIKR